MGILLTVGLVPLTYPGNLLSNNLQNWLLASNLILAGVVFYFGWKVGPDHG
jgi:hypothetical protein